VISRSHPTVIIVRAYTRHFIQVPVSFLADSKQSISPTRLSEPPRRAPRILPSPFSLASMPPSQSCVLDHVLARWVYPVPLVLHSLSLPAYMSMRVVAATLLMMAALLLCCPTRALVLRDMVVLAGVPHWTMSMCLKIELSGRYDCVELRCLAIMFVDAQMASPVPSPVHLYKDSVSRRRRCCSPPSSGIRPRTCASADCMTFRNARCSLSVSESFQQYVT
jgi:hypothetical protein